MGCRRPLDFEVWIGLAGEARINISSATQSLALHARLSTGRAPRRFLIALGWTSINRFLPPICLPNSLFVSYDDNEHRPSSSFVAACLLTTSFIQLRLHFLVRMIRGAKWCARMQALLSPLKIIIPLTESLTWQRDIKVNKKDDSQ